MFGWFICVEIGFVQYTVQCLLELLNLVEVSVLFCICFQCNKSLFVVFCVSSDMIGFEKAYCEYRLNRVEHALKTIQGIPEQTDKLKELYGQVVRVV